MLEPLFSNFYRLNQSWIIICCELNPQDLPPSIFKCHPSIPTLFASIPPGFYVNHLFLLVRIRCFSFENLMMFGRQTSLEKGFDFRGQVFEVWRASLQRLGFKPSVVPRLLLSECLLDVSQMAKKMVIQPINKQFQAQWVYNGITHPIMRFKGQQAPVSYSVYHQWFPTTRLLFMIQIIIGLMDRAD